MLLIKNGRVMDPASRTDATLDVLLDGEKINEVGPAGKIAAPQGAEIFDASGLIVAPGFIDLHVHLREPGQESSETIGLLHAEYQAGERQCFGDAIHRGSREGGRHRSCLADWSRVGGEQGRGDCGNRRDERSRDRGGFR
jgi:hypothetical protein